MKTTAIILAAGSGSRMNSGITKQRLLIGNKSVLYRTVSAFEECESIADIIVMVRYDEIDFACKELSSFKKIRKITAGGATRFESAKIGVAQITWQYDYVAIHDGARCFVTSDMIDSVNFDAYKYGAATASNKITDTVKRIDADGNIIETLDRSTLVCAQTPQIFKKEIYNEALNLLNIEDYLITDDNMLAERIGFPVHCTETGKRNIKITVPEDLFLAECLLNGEIDNV